MAGDIGEIDIEVVVVLEEQVVELVGNGEALPTADGAGVVTDHWAVVKLTAH